MNPKPGIFDPEMTPEELRRRTAWTVIIAIGVAIWGLVILAGFVLVRWLS